MNQREKARAQKLFDLGASGKPPTSLPVEVIRRRPGSSGDASKKRKKP
jgi:hypothetical protein